eukprot:6697657-Pyramimonas_sp.AAC.1
MLSDALKDHSARDAADGVAGDGAAVPTGSASSCASGSAAAEEAAAPSDVAEAEAPGESADAEAEEEAEAEGSEDEVLQDTPPEGTMKAVIRGKSEFVNYEYTYHPDMQALLASHLITSPSLTSFSAGCGARGALEADRRHHPQDWPADVGGGANAPF